MKLSPKVKEALLQAPAKALATYASGNVNVVPVSSVKIVDDEIWLINYFFDKTISNIQKNEKIALTFWSGLNGFQLKADAFYETEGNQFEDAVQWIATAHPNRLVKGLVKLKPTEVFDISIANKRI